MNGPDGVSGHGGVSGPEGVSGRPGVNGPEGVNEYRFSVAATVMGQAAGAVIVLDEPLSMWGGLDATNGQIIDRHHPQFGQCISGLVVIMARGRGSSSASSVLAEAVRLGTAPAAFVLHEPDEIIALGVLVAEEIYAIPTPVVVINPHDATQIETGDRVRIDPPVLHLEKMTKAPAP